MIAAGFFSFHLLCCFVFNQWLHIHLFFFLLLFAFDIGKSLILFYSCLSASPCLLVYAVKCRQSLCCHCFLCCHFMEIMSNMRWMNGLTATVADCYFHSIIYFFYLFELLLTVFFGFIYCQSERCWCCWRCTVWNFNER